MANETDQASDDAATIGERLAELHRIDRDNARQAVGAARRELRVAIRRLSEQADDLPDTLGQMNVDELIGTMTETAEALRIAADQAAVAYDDLESADDS
jgi:glutamine synthetase adenylyltransferase